jgi:DNA invertase Pin-like site-specific DNA recombinase
MTSTHAGEAIQASPAGLRAIGYTRVSTDEQVDSGAGLAAQRAVLTLEAARRGWELEIVQEAGLSAKDLARPALTDAMEWLDKRQADVLVVAKLDRLSRSVRDFTTVLERAKRRGWSVVCCDLGVDTTSPSGEFMANVIASASQYERRLIGARTSAAMQAQIAAGQKFGRPDRIPAVVLARIAAERRGGATLQAIATGLDASAVPTAQGGKRWYPSTIKAALALT